MATRDVKHPTSGEYMDPSSPEARYVTDAPSLYDVGVEFWGFAADDFISWFGIGFCVTAAPKFRMHRKAWLPPGTVPSCIVSGFAFGFAKVWYEAYHHHERVMTMNPEREDLEKPDPFINLPKMKITSPLYIMAELEEDD